VIVNKNKNIKIKKIAIFSLAAIFFLPLAMSLLLASFADARDSNTGVKETTKLNGREVAGSIIIAKNPNKALEIAKDKGLKTSFVHKAKNRPAIVAIEELPSDPRLKSIDAQPDTEVVPNYVYKTAFTPNDPKYPDQWNLAKISASKAWDISKGNSNVTIAVIDTGILSSQTINGTTYTQPDFPTSRLWTNANETGMTQAGDACWTGTPADKQTNDCDDDGNGLVDDWRGWDFMAGFRGDDAGCPNNGDSTRYESDSDPTFVAQDNDPQPYSCDSPSSPSILNKNHYNGNCVAWTSACYVGHGTMVSSVAAADADNSQLIAGIDHNAKIMDVRVLDGYGYGTTARLVAGINYAVDNGADVINMSLGSNCDDNNFTDSAMESALSAAASAGIVSVAASGNEGMTSSICYPASSQYVMAVGATDQNDNRRSYSNYSNKLDVVAPDGVPVANAPSGFINSNYYSNAGGTSLSTPHVASLAALLKSVNPNFSRIIVRDYIRNGADKVAGMGGANFHSQYGYGRINLQKSLFLSKLEHPEGTLVKTSNSSTVYLLENEEKRAFPSSVIFVSQGFRWDRIKTATVADMNLTLGAQMALREGTIVKGSTTTIYAIDVLDDGSLSKRAFSSWNVFSGLGYTSGEVVKVGDASLPSQNGPAIASAVVHPDGALIKHSGSSTVYLLENEEKRAFPSSVIFVSQGFRWDRIKTATVADMNLTLGAQMALREGTIVKGSTTTIYAIDVLDDGSLSKRAFSSWNVFSGLGYTSSEVIKIKDTGLPSTTGLSI
jgi:subtilisin family serine protease